MSILGIIPARGGSKSIPKKNLVKLNGLPLIQYSIEAGLSSKRIDTLIVSTDDEEIAKECERLGVSVPFLRPPLLAEDNTPMIAVLQHALDWYEKRSEEISALVLLQPTSPLRTHSQIDETIDRFFSSNADSVVSVTEVPHQFIPSSILAMKDGWMRQYLPDEPRLTRRQDKPVFYARNGPAILVVDPKLIREGELYGKRSHGYIMSRFSSIDIDTREDLQLAEMILNSKII